MLEDQEELGASSMQHMNVEGAPQADLILQKVYRNTLPLLCAVAAFCYIDRTNLSYAAPSLTRDLNFSPSVYGTGSGLFFAGYSLAMIPSQLLGLRIGVSRWLGIQVSVWGLVAASFSTVSTVRQFYVLRFLLGVAEAGAFPAIWYYLYTMLPKEALTLPFSALEAAVSTANVLSAPLAAGLLLLEGASGDRLKGWQWLFLCEGIITLAAGLTTVLVLPAGLAQASFLSGADRRWLTQQQGRSYQVQAKDDGDLFTDVRILKEAFLNWRVWFVSTMGIFKNVAANAMLFWLPLLVVSLLHEGDAFQHAGPVGASSSRTGAAIASAPRALLTARSVLAASAAGNSTARLAVITGHAPPAAPPGLSLPVLLSSIPFLCTAIFSLLLGRSSQARGERALHLALPYLTAGLLFGALSLIKSASLVLGFVALSIAIACTVGSNCVSNAYIPAVASASSVSVAMALYNSVSNLGGILGPWVIGVLVEHTGNYDSAIQLLGLVMVIAGAMAWSTRGWEVASSQRSPAKPEPAISLTHSRSVGVGVSELQGLLSTRA